MATWYYHVDNKEFGPVSSEELAELARSGIVTKDSLVWKEGLLQWINASQIKGLKFTPPPTTVPRSPTGGGPIPIANAALNPPAEATNIANSIPINSAISSVGVSSGVVAPQSGSVAGGEKGLRFRKIMPWIVAGGSLVIVFGMSLWMLLGGSSKGTKDSLADRTGDVRVDRLQNELEEQRRNLRDEVKKLQEQRDRLERENRDVKSKQDDLKKEEDRLKKEIQNLVGRRESLVNWRDVDLVMINPAQNAVGLRDDQKLIVHAITEGDDVPIVARIAARSGKPSIPDNKELARRLAMEYKVGEAISPEDERTIRNQHWKPRKFTPAFRGQDVEFVAFRERDSRESRVAFYVPPERGEHPRTTDGVEIFAFDGRSETIPFARIEPGTLRRGTAKRLFETFGDIDFLDYCILKVAQELGPTLPDNSKPTYVRVGVDVSVRIPLLNQALGASIESQLREFGAERSRRDGIGNLILFLGSFWARKLNFDHFLHANLHEVAQKVEDEVGARLTALGIPVVIQPKLPLDPNELDVFRWLLGENATHFVSIAVEDSRGAGQCRLVVSLRDVCGNIVWTDNANLNLRTQQYELPGHSQQFHIHSGRLAMAQAIVSGGGGFDGTEDPPVVRRLNRNAQNRHLIYVEDDQSSETLQYRTLFSRELRNIKRADVQVKYVELADDVPDDLMFRYVVCRIAGAILPPAGRVIGLPNGETATCSIGKRHGLRVGDKLRVIRIKSGPSSPASIPGSPRGYGLVLSGTEAILPTMVAVTEIGDYHSVVHFSQTGFEDIWPENAPIKLGDLLVVNSEFDRQLSVIPMKVVNPTQQLFVRLELGKPAVAQRYTSYAEQTATQFSETVINGLQTLKVPTIETLQRAMNSPSSKQKNSDRAIGPTHVLQGTITLSPTMLHDKKTGPGSAPLYRIDLKVTPQNSTEIVDGFDFDFGDHLVPKTKDVRSQ